MAILSSILRAVSGVIALLFGRRVFWLFIMVVGFLAGFIVGKALFPEASVIVNLLTGLALGILGTLLSKFLPVVITAIFGFIIGGAVLVGLVKLFTPINHMVLIILFALGGLISVILTIKLFDLSLVILSSISGASILASWGSEMLAYSNVTQTIIFAVLAIIGIVVQLSLVKPDKENTTKA